MEKVTGVVATLRKWDTNILCLSESQCAWENFHVRNNVQEELRKVDKYAGMIGSSSCVACGDSYKPGGTVTLYDGNWSGRLTKGVDPHKLGRWSYVTLFGRNDTFLTIITGYRCCRKQTIATAGMITTYMQQERILRQRRISSTPQKSFIDDMAKFIETKVKEGHEILLALDANEQWEDPDSEIREMALGLGLFDIAKERHSDGVPPTYVRKNSTRRIDFLLGSENVLKATMAYGMFMSEEVIMGDHRAQYIDININELLQLNIHDIGSPSSRRLRSTDIKSVKIYTDILKNHFMNHKIYQRMEKLWEDARQQIVLTPKQIQTYEAIDRDVYRLCTNAENNLKLYTYTKFLWSPALDDAMKEVQHWKLRKKHVKDRRKSRELVKKGQEKGYGDENNTTVNEIDKALSQSYKSLHKIQKKDCAKRQEYLNELAEKYAQQNNISKKMAIRELLSHEELREMYRTIRLRMAGMTSPQLTEVWVDDGEGGKTIISNSNEIEEHLLHRNWQQLRQAASTPFADGEWGEDIKWDGTGDMADRIVDGKPLPEIAHKSDVIQKYIEGMAVSDPSIIASVDTEITLEQYKAFWKAKRETTATSPFGLHIGHYKIVLDSEYTDILEIQHKLLIIPFKYAMIPLRWAKTVQVLLEKDSGRPYSHRLRIIELFDSQVNAGLQMIFGKRMIQNALDKTLIHESAYGSVPNRSAQDAVLEKTLSLDILRVTKKTGAIFDCDTKGCYDRIVASLQTVTNRRLGVPRKTAIFFARFWRICEHFVKTRFGISKGSFTSTSTEMLYGIGQGNGAGPAFWLATLIVMFCVLDELCIGMSFTSPWGTSTHRSTGLGYVDDVTLGTTTNVSDDANNDDIIQMTEDEEHQVHKNMTVMGQNWETMLHTNGGLLELKKCFWILISWKWIKGVAVMKSAHEITKELTIKQTEDSREITIPMKDVKEAPRVLGCHVAADGNWMREFGKWKTEAAMFAKKVKNARFSRSCGGRVYSSLWMSKLRYIASVVCFTQEQSIIINRKVVTQCLPASGFNRNFPRQVVHGPKRYGGMAWESCQSVQIVEKIKFIMTHMRRDDKLGNLLKILIDTLQLKAGLSEPILVTDKKWQRWVEPTWVHNLKDGLDQIGGALHTNCRTPMPQRQYDRSLMEIFDSWELKDEEMEALNRCRVYLRVVYVSDITELDGLSIVPEALEVRFFRPSTYIWARQVRPIRADRNIWRRSLEKLCYSGELITSLGKWLRQPHQVWPYMTTAQGTLLRNIGGVQKEMSLKENRQYKRDGTVLLTVKNGIPVNCKVTASGYKVVDDPNKVNTITPERDLFDINNKALNKTMGYIKSQNLRQLRERWKKGDNWYIGTDGGLKKCRHMWSHFTQQNARY